MSLKLRIRWATQLNQGLPVPPPMIPVQAYSRDHQFLEITNSTDDTRYKRSSFSIPDRVVNDQWYPHSWVWFCGSWSTLVKSKHRVSRREIHAYMHRWALLYD